MIPPLLALVTLLDLGGASGPIAAAALDERGLRVVLLDPARLATFDDRGARTAMVPIDHAPGQAAVAAIGPDGVWLAGPRQSVGDQESVALRGPNQAAARLSPAVPGCEPSGACDYRLNALVARAGGVEIAGWAGIHANERAFVPWRARWSAAQGATAWPAEPLGYESEVVALSPEAALLRGRSAGEAWSWRLLAANTHPLEPPPRAERALALASGPAGHVIAWLDRAGAPILSLHQPDGQRLRLGAPVLPADAEITHAAAAGERAVVLAGLRAGAPFAALVTLP